MSLDYRFGFTGTRKGMTVPQQTALRKYLAGGGGEFHHGDCIGADAEAHALAADCGYCPVIHPPVDHSLRAWCKAPSHLIRVEKTHFARNRDIVDETVVLIATPAEFEEQLRGGTWYTVGYARKRGKPTMIILPDGTPKWSLPADFKSNGES